jgi:hypothetical protein
MLAVGTYGGKSLYGTKGIWESHSCGVVPGRDVVLNISGGGVPHLTVRSLDKTYLIPVIQAIEKTWLEPLHDIVQAWLAGALAEDEVYMQIAEGIPPEDRCTCSTDVDRAQNIHKCASCLRTKKCAFMTEISLGLKIYTICQTKDSFDAQGIHRLVETLARSVLRMALYYEPQFDDDETDKRWLEDAWEEVKTSLQRVPDSAIAYFDNLREKIEPLPIEGGGQLKPNPLQFILDVRHPIGKAISEGQHRVHTQGNLDPTCIVINRFKHIQNSSYTTYYCGIHERQSRALKGPRKPTFSS